MQLVAIRGHARRLCLARGDGGQSVCEENAQAVKAGFGVAGLLRGFVTLCEIRPSGAM
jgi:hypothetical protein